jgi:hypothetical protein
VYNSTTAFASPLVPEAQHNHPRALLLNLLLAWLLLLLLLLQTMLSGSSP